MRTNLGRREALVFDDDTGQTVLRLASTDEFGGAVEQAYPTGRIETESPDPSYRVYWPMVLPGIKCNVVIDASGQMFFLVPANFVADQSSTVNVLSFPDCDVVFNQHATVINMIKDALVEHGILGAATVTVTPDAANCVAKSNGPSTVVPVPITAIARTTKSQSIMTCVARGVNPKVNGVLLISPDPISAIAQTTMHNPYVGAQAIWAVCGSKQPTVLIS